MPAIILAFLPYLFQAAQTIPEIWDFLQKIRADLQQSGEWDKATEDAYTAELAALKSNPPSWWQTDVP
jgi:hypothetical protein